MMKKIISILIASLMLLQFSACTGTSTSTQSNHEFDTNREEQSAVVVEGSDEVMPNNVSASFVGTFDESKFSGKIKGCNYGEDGKLFVQADKLYLYDLLNCSIINEIVLPFNDYIIQPYNGGYMLAGQGDDGVMVCLYDKNLRNATEIVFNNLLVEDFILSPNGVAISTDGKTIAVAGLSGLYLYDTQDGKLETLLRYNIDKDDGNDNFSNITIGYGTIIKKLS